MLALRNKANRDITLQFWSSSSANTDSVDSSLNVFELTKARDSYDSYFKIMAINESYHLLSGRKKYIVKEFQMV